MAHIFGDRRVNRRYPLELPLRYRVWQSKSQLILGTGMTVDLSSGGVAFTAETELAAGQSIELWVKWPVAGEHKELIELHVSGSIVRSEGKRTGLKIWRHSFVVTGENSSKPAERVMMADNAAPAPKKPDGS